MTCNVCDDGGWVLKQRFRDGPMADYRAAKDAFIGEVLAARGVALIESEP
jgi:hypothetical protein